METIWFFELHEQNHVEDVENIAFVFDLIGVNVRRDANVHPSATHFATVGGWHGRVGAWGKPWMVARFVSLAMEVIALGVRAWVRRKDGDEEIIEVTPEYVLSTLTDWLHDLIAQQNARQETGAPANKRATLRASVIDEETNQFSICDEQGEKVWNCRYWAGSQRSMDQAYAYVRNQIQWLESIGYVIAYDQENQEV